MQPAPKGKNWGSGSMGNRRARRVVDPRPGDARDIGINPPAKRRIVVDPAPGKKKIMIPKPNPGAKKAPIVKPLPIKKAPIKQTPIKVQPPSVDDKIFRTMPITEKDLGRIKKMYGI